MVDERMLLFFSARKRISICQKATFREEILGASTVATKLSCLWHSAKGR